MKIVCAWCKKDMGEKTPLKDKSITHTICPDCANKMLKDIPNVQSVIRM